VGTEHVGNIVEAAELVPVRPVLEFNMVDPRFVARKPLCCQSWRVIPLISMPTPRGQEAQLDQVVEAHRIAREGRIDYASGKEEEDQDQFSSSGRPAAVRAVAGWAVLGELAAGTDRSFASGARASTMA
jgi:hypothetical protein